LTSLFKTSFRILGHKVPLAIAGLGVAAIIGVGALVIHEKKKVKRITMNLQPNPLTQERPSVLTGQFLDADDKPVKISMGRYLVMLTQPGQQPQVVRGGLIANTSQFNATIDTKGLPSGTYKIIVQDSLNPEKQDTPQQQQ
jgi:hypothetical protein